MDHFPHLPDDHHNHSIGDDRDVVLKDLIIAAADDYGVLVSIALLFF